MSKDIAGIITVAVVLLLIGTNIGTRGMAIHSTRTEAVEAGHAEWVPETDGSTTFRWKEAMP